MRIEGRVLELDPDEVALAIYAYALAHGYHIGGPRTIVVRTTEVMDGGEERLLNAFEWKINVDTSGRLHWNGCPTCAEPDDERKEDPDA